MRKYSVALVLSLILFACNPQPLRNARITPVDLKSKKLEYVRSNLESVLGSDSAGQAALEYIKDYESELNDNYPDYRDYKFLPLEKMSDQFTDTWSFVTPTPPPLPYNEVSAVNNFTAFLKGRMMYSEILLNQSYADFISTHNYGHAKLGIAAGYVAISSNLWNVRLQEIIDKTDLLLDSLYAKASLQPGENITQ